MAFGPPQSQAFFQKLFAPDVGLLETWLPNFGDCLAYAIDRCFGWATARRAC